MTLGIGSAIGKVLDWLPGRRESKENKIEKLINENARLAQEEPLSARTANRISVNINTIKQLRSEVSRII